VIGEVAELVDKLAGLVSATTGLVLLIIAVRRLSRRERGDSAHKTVEEVLKIASVDPRVSELLLERLEAEGKDDAGN